MYSNVTTDVIIIGAGPTGLFTIFQAGMLGMRCHVIDSSEVVGGQCAILYPEKLIYDIPAYPKISAGHLIEQLKEQASPFEPVYHLGQQAVSFFQEGDIIKVGTSKNVLIKSKVLIIASGPGSFAPNKPKIEGIENFEEKSLFYFVKNASNFKNKRLVIAGGGDSALDWAISLSEFTKKIYLVHRRSKFNAKPESLKKAEKISITGKLEFVLNYQIDRLIGNGSKLEEVLLKDLDGNKKSILVDNLLLCFGLSQNLGPLSDWGLGIKSHHIQVTMPHYTTNIPGVYAIGDVAQYPGKLKLILFGFVEATSSLHHAYSRVFNGKALHFEHSTSKLGNNSVFS